MGVTNCLTQILSQTGMNESVRHLKVPWDLRLKTHLVKAKIKVLSFKLTACFSLAQVGQNDQVAC